MACSQVLSPLRGLLVESLPFQGLATLASDCRPSGALDALLKLRKQGIQLSLLALRAPLSRQRNAMRGFHLGAEVAEVFAQVGFLAGAA